MAFMTDNIIYKIKVDNKKKNIYKTKKLVVNVLKQLPAAPTSKLLAIVAV